MDHMWAWMLFWLPLGAIGLWLWFSYAAAKDRAAYERAPDILDELFAGDARVVYRTGVYAIPPTEVVEGASERGYILESDTKDLNGRAMAFRRSDKAPESDTPQEHFEEHGSDSRSARHLDQQHDRETTSDEKRDAESRTGKGLGNKPLGAVIVVGLFGLFWSCAGGSDGSSRVDGDALAAEVQRAVRDSYGADNPTLASVIRYSGRDAPRVTVVTSLSGSASNESLAQDICMTVASVGISVPDFTGVYVTAGDGGRFLAECRAVR